MTWPCLTFSYMKSSHISGSWQTIACVLLLLAAAWGSGHDALAAGDLHLSKSAPYSWYLFGLVQELDAEYEHAYKSLETASELDPEAVPVIIELARVAIRLGKMDAAEKWTEQALVIEPDNMRLKMMLARIYVAVNDTDSAISLLGEVLEEEPENEEALFLLGSLYAQARNFPQAVVALRKAAKQKGTRSFMAHYYLGKIYLERQEMSKAREEFSKAIAANPRFIPLYFDLARVYEAENDIENALRIWRMLLKRQPGNPRAQAGIIDLMLKQGRLEDAIIQLNGLDSSKADYLPLRFKVAMACLQNNKPDKALAILKPMADIRPGNSRILFYMALALEQSGRIEDAITMLKSIDPSDRLGTEAAVRAAYLLHKQGRAMEARQFLEKYLETDVPDPEIVPALARIYEQDGEVEMAEALLKKTVDAGYGNKVIFMQLAMLCEDQGRREKAIYWAKRALEIDEDYVPALNFLGYTWAEQGINLDSAEEMISRAVSLQPDDGYIIDSLGWVHFVQGKYGQAVIELEKAHGMVPDDSTIAEHLGDALVKKYKYFKALKVYKQALKYEKKNNNRRRIQKKIKKAGDMMSDMVDQ